MNVSCYDLTRFFFYNFKFLLINILGMAMPDTNAFKVLRAQKPHTDEELELIQGTVFQRAVPEFAPV